MISRAEALALVVTILAFAVPGLRAAELDPAMRARIAAIASGGDGAPVTEELLRRHEGSGPAARARKAALVEAAAVAAPFLDASVRKAGWNDSHMGIDGPVCFDAAPKLGLMFRAKGFPVYVATTGSHVFLIANFPEGMFVVDPTVRQYLGQDQAPSWVPQVFVGGVSELAALYARDPQLPVLPYREIYFNPERPASRKDSMIISKRDRFLWSASSEEYAPLTAYFNAEARRSRLQAFGESALPAQFRDWARADRTAPLVLRPGR